MKPDNPIRLGRPVRWTAIAVAAAVLLAVPVFAQIQFSDVPADNPHRGDINYVAGERWFLGYRDGTYKPDQKITPDQMTNVLTRAFEEGITRAEFASFMTAGNEWRQRIKTIPDYRNRVVRTGLYIVEKPGEERREGLNYISPGRIRIRAEKSERYCPSNAIIACRWNPGNYRYRTVDAACRWMRLGFIPEGGQNFDTIAATDAPIAGYIQLTYTEEPYIIRIEPTDTALQVDCET